MTDLLALDLLFSACVFLLCSIIARVTILRLFTFDVWFHIYSRPHSISLLRSIFRALWFLFYSILR